MTKLSGGIDPKEYISWALKVDKIFEHDFDEPKAIAMASLEFDGYALIWWDKYKNFDKRKEKPPLPLGMRRSKS